MAESKALENETDAAPAPVHNLYHDSFLICNTNGMRVSNINGYLYPPFITAHGVNWLRNNWITDSDDIIVATYPKTGTMWTLNIVIEIIKQSFPLQTIYKTIKQGEWIENVASNKGFDYFYQLTSNHDLTNCPRRIWQTHSFYSQFPCKTLDKNTKIIYITRCPKDVIVSSFHFFSKEPNIAFKGDFNTFFEWFCDGITPNGNYFDHVMEWYRVKENILLLYYEDMKDDLFKTIKTIAQFIGCNHLLNNDKINIIADNSTFDAMKKAAKSEDVHLAPSFFRKGISKDWLSHLNAKQSERIDRLIRTRFYGTDIKYFRELNQVNDININQTVTVNKVMDIIDDLLSLLSTNSK